MPDKNIEELLNDLTELNNELMNTQRILLKKNIEIEDLNQRLSSVNLALEDFTYLASHDLKEPLRMISSFMKKLENTYAPQLDEKAKRYIHFAVDGATRMTTLINEMLAYAKFGDDEQFKEPTNINTVLLEIEEMNQGIITENGASITYEEMPTIMAFKTPVKILFQNLISNALKYMPEGKKSEINVRYVESALEWQFEVTDNGIGINPKHHEEIFKLFKRLHSREKYEGTGMGLATCKKIAEKHGGKIWLISEEGIGSTFYFTLKK